MNVSVEELSITVAGGRKLLDAVNCLVQAGDMIALMGPSGAGKTTLLNSIVGRPISGITEGGIYYDGTSLAKVRQGGHGWLHREVVVVCLPKLYQVFAVKPNMTIYFFLFGGDDDSMNVSMSLEFFGATMPPCYDLVTTLLGSSR